MSEGDFSRTSDNPFIAIIIPNKVDGKRFKPIPIEYISGDNKEEICIINETLKIDSTGITNREVVDDFPRGVHSVGPEVFLRNDHARDDRGILRQRRVVSFDIWNDDRHSWLEPLHVHARIQVGKKLFRAVESLR